MRVIFLDIDGVLCTRRSHLVFGDEGSQWFYWDPLACAALRRVCDRGISLVISSTWRLSKNEADLCKQLAAHQLWSYLYVPDWKTPDIRSDRRSEEIMTYLSAHSEIKDYRVIDDMALEIDAKKFIRTDEYEGMTSDNIKKLFNWAGVLKS